MQVPPIYSINKIDFKQPQKIILQNNIPLFLFSDDKQDIIKLDIVFNAGRWTESKHLTADAVSALFKSGTEKFNSFEINEKIDSLGATLKASTGYNTFTISLACLGQYLQACVDIISLCLNDIIFPEDELQLFQKNAKAKLAINLEKSDYIADRIFKEKIFGNNHAYGYSTTNERIDNLNRADLIEYYQHQLSIKNCTIFAAGNLSQKAVEYIEKTLGKWNKNNLQQAKGNHQQTIQDSEKNSVIKREKSAQASIVVGKKMFNKHNKDYGVFMLLNTIFGGYFGSRLMNNIREEKGLTYGIYAVLQPLKYDGYWAIYTDTNLEKVDLCIHEIIAEINTIQHDLIDNEEIKLARNYLLGRFLKRTDGAFNLMETYKSYYIEEIDIEQFGTFIEDIRQADSKKLREIAQKYLTLDSMYQIIVR